MRMTDEQLRMALGGVGEHEPELRALQQVLGELIADDDSAAINSALTPEARAYNCGRAAALSDARSFLVEMGLKLEAPQE